MAGKVHTYSEALYAVRAAIIRFADGFGILRAILPVALRI